MTDPIDSMPDDALGETFAVEVAGWRLIPDAKFMSPLYGHADGREAFQQELPKFAKSADAVLPFLEKVAFRFEAGKALGCQYGVVICGTGNFTEWGVGGWHRAIQPTFARAAAIALIRHARAERAQKGGA